MEFQHSASAVTEDVFLWVSAFLSIVLIGRAISVPITQLVLKLKYDTTTQKEDDPLLALRRELVYDRLISLFQTSTGVVVQVIRALAQLLLGNVSLLIITGILLLLSIFTQAYGFDVLNSMLSAYNLLIGPTIGTIKRFAAMFLMSGQVLLPVWNLFVILGQGVLKIALQEVGGCAASAMVQSGTSFALGAGELSVQLALLVSRSFGGEMNLTSAYTHLGNSLLAGSKAVHCTCSPLTPFVNITLAPFNTPDLYMSLSNGTNALLFPLEGVHALLTLSKPKFEDRFYAAEAAVLRGGDTTDYWIQSIAGYAVTGSTWIEPGSSTQYVPNWDWPLPISGKMQFVVPSGSVERTAGVLIGSARATATAICAGVDFLRVLYNFIVNLNEQWSKTATIADRKALFNLDRPIGFVKDSVYISNNVTLFLVSDIGFNPIRRAPAFMRDLALLEIGALHYVWQLGVGIVFAVESSVSKKSGMLFVTGFEETRVRFEQDVILPALEASWSASRLVSGPEYALGPPVYHALAGATQMMNTSMNLIYCSISLFEDTQRSTVSADMFATVFDPLYEELSEFLESMISIFALSPLLYDSASCFGTSTNEQETFSADMDPIPAAYWAEVGCMDSGLCDLMCAESHEVWVNSAVPDSNPTTLCATSTCDPLKSCLGCNPACQSSCDLARSCRLSKCYSTRVNLVWGGCNVGNTVVELMQTAIASFRSMLRMLIYDIEAGVRHKDPPRAWPTNMLKGVSCGMYHTQASLGAAIPSTFWGLISGGGQFGTEERGKNILFAVSQFSAAIVSRPSVYVNSMLDAVIGIFEKLGSADSSTQIIQDLAKSPFVLMESFYKANLVVAESMALGLFQICDAAINKPECSHSSSVVECPQLSIITIANVFKDLQEFLPPIAQLAYDVTDFGMRYLLVIVQPSEQNQRAFISSFMNLFREFEHLLIMAGKIVEQMVLSSPLGKEIEKLMIEAVCEGIIKIWNDFVDDWNKGFEFMASWSATIPMPGPIPDVHLGRWFHFMKSWELPDSAKIPVPSFCSGIGHEFDGFVPIPVASLCSSDGECTGNSECIDLVQSPIKLKQCSQCPNNGQATCSVFTRSCACGTAASSATTCSTNSQCFHPTSKCMQITGPFSVPFSIAPCMSATSPLEAMMPLCSAAAISADRSVCVAASSVNAALGVRVPQCASSAAAGQSCSFPTDPSQSCLALPAFPSTTVTNYDDLMLVGCGLCDSSRGFVCIQFRPNPSGPFQTACACVLRSEQYKTGRRLLAASTRSEETHLPAWSPEFLELGVREVTSCETDLDCISTHPPSVCSRMAYHGNQTLRVFCDACPAGSNILGMRPRVCLEGTCRCQRQSDYGSWDLLSESTQSGQLLSGIVRKELRIERHGTCAVLLRGLVERTGNNTQWDVLVGEASLAEKAILEGCVVDIMNRDVIQRLTGMSDLSLPLISLDNAVHVGAQVVGTAQALWEAWELKGDPTVVWAALRSHGVNPQAALPLLQRIETIIASLYYTHYGSVWEGLDRWAAHPDTNPGAARKYKAMRHIATSAHRVYSDMKSGAHARAYDAVSQALRPTRLSEKTGSNSATVAYNENRRRLLPHRKLSAQELALESVPEPRQPPRQHTRRLMSTDALAVPFIDLADTVKQCAVAEDLVELTAESFVLFGNYYKLLMPTLLNRLSQYLVEPFGRAPVPLSTKSIVYDSQVTIRERPASPESDRIRRFYETGSRDSIEHEVLGWILDTPITQPLDALGALFASPAEAEKTILHQFACSPSAIMLSDRADDPLWSAATVAATIGALFVLGLFGVPLARPIAMVMLVGYFAAWMGHAYGVSTLCLPAIPTAAPVDLLDMINRCECARVLWQLSPTACFSDTPAAHVHSLLLEQLTEGTSYDSETDSPSDRCRKLGFENSFDSLTYLLSVSATFVYVYGFSCFQVRFSFEKPAAPPLDLLAFALRIFNVACRLWYSSQCSWWCRLSTENRVWLWLKWMFFTTILHSRTHRASSTEKPLKCPQ